MKKLFISLLCFCPLAAFGAEPLMLIKPSREVFVNFPSAFLPDKAVTVFLPEPAVPLHGTYPVVYVLGAVPTDAPAVQAALEGAWRKAIIVGVNVETGDLADSQKLAAFFTRELVPYIDTNYPTVQDPAARAVAAQGASGVRAAIGLLRQKELVGRAVWVHPGTEALSVAGADKALRLLVAGRQEELAVWQQTLQEDMAKTYGPDFVLKRADQTDLFSQLELDYVFAPAKELAVDQLQGHLSARTLPLDGTQTASLAVTAVLKNRMRFDFIPLSVRLSPPYLSWDAATGLLTPVPGAAAGKVKIGVFVDKTGFSDKIKLKK